MRHLELWLHGAIFLNRSHYPEKASDFGFKGATAPRFGPSDVLCIYSNEHLRNGISDTFDMKSKYFGPVIPKKPKNF